MSAESGTVSYYFQIWLAWTATPGPAYSTIPPFKGLSLTNADGITQTLKKTQDREIDKDSTRPGSGHMGQVSSEALTPARAIARLT